MEAFVLQGLNSLIDSWITFIFFVVFTGFLYRTFKKDTHSLHAKMDLVIASRDELIYLRENFEEVKSIRNMLSESDSFYSVIDTLLTNVIGQLNANFTNGSSVQRGLADCDDFHMQFIEILNRRTDIPQSQRINFTVLVEVLYEELVRLTNQLDLLTDYSIKPKLIVPFGKSLRGIVHYFGINVGAKYKGLPEKAVKTDLLQRLRLTGT